jgi:hypothetical protein
VNVEGISPAWLRSTQGQPTGTRDRGARRTADDQRGLARLQTGDAEELVRRHLDDRPLDHPAWLVGEVVGSQARGRVSLELQGDADVEAGPLRPEIEASDAREEADRRQVSHGV